MTIVAAALTAAAASAQQAPVPAADRAAPRTDQNSMIAHAQLLEKAKAQHPAPGQLAEDEVIQRAYLGARRAAG